MGAYDDLFGLKATQKFIGLGLISIIFYLMGGRIEILSIPFVGSVHLPMVLGLILTLRACLKRPGEKQAEGNYDRDDAFVRQHFQCPRPRPCRRRRRFSAASR